MTEFCLVGSSCFDHHIDQHSNLNQKIWKLIQHLKPCINNETMKNLFHILFLISFEIVKRIPMLQQEQTDV